MEFFNYKPEEVKIGDTVIGNSKIRFRDTVFAAHVGEVPFMDVWTEKSTTYLDGRVFNENIGLIKETLSLEDMGRMIDLYHPVLGTIIGQISVGEVIGIIYSMCIDADKRNDARIAAELEAQANNEQPTEPTI